MYPGDATPSDSKMGAVCMGAGEGGKVSGGAVAAYVRDWCADTRRQSRQGIS